MSHAQRQTQQCTLTLNCLRSCVVLCAQRQPPFICLVLLEGGRQGHSTPTGISTALEYGVEHFLRDLSRVFMAVGDANIALHPQLFSLFTFEYQSLTEVKCS